MRCAPEAAVSGEARSTFVRQVTLNFPSQIVHAGAAIPRPKLDGTPFGAVGRCFCSWPKADMDPSKVSTSALVSAIRNGWSTQPESAVQGRSRSRDGLGPVSNTLQLGFLRAEAAARPPPVSSKTAHRIGPRLAGSGRPGGLSLGRTR
jgi:hypothetical protein